MTFKFFMYIAAVGSLASYCFYLIHPALGALVALYFFYQLAYTRGYERGIEDITDRMPFIMHEQFKNEPHQGIRPPWIEYPGYPPADSFWRQTGQAWFADIWEPFWKQLNDQEQQDYLILRNAPEEWRHFYSPEFQKWLYSDEE